MPVSADRGDPAFLSIVEATRAYAGGSLSPVEVAREQFARIHAHNGRINAFTLLDEERALQAARASEARWRRGEPLGPLDGVCFTAKDNQMVAGYPFRRGSLTTPTTPVTESSPMVARCIESGAVFIGLTAMPEFGLGPVTISPLSGITSNPWDTGRQAGGSSGGGAAALAAGFCSLSLATDAGGSIRIPAALTGVVGLKPSGARVPVYPPSVVGGLSCSGPITRSVEDAALMLGLLSRADARDPAALPADAADYRAGLGEGVRGWKIALSMTLGYARRVHPEVEAAIRAAAEVFRSLGAVVEECDPGIDDPIEAYLTLLSAGYRYSLRNLGAAQKELLSPGLREIVEDTREITLIDYLKALEHCMGLARRLQAFHAGYEVLLTPTVAVPAFERDRAYPADFEQFPNRRAWTPYTSLFNLTQQPAISVPAGLTRDGLPIGLHIAGPRNAEAKILRAAHAYAQAAPFNQRPSL